MVKGEEIMEIRLSSTLRVNGEEGLNNDNIRRMVRKYAARIGLCNLDLDRIEDRFSPHCCPIGSQGMPREHIKELRDDVRKKLWRSIITLIAIN